MKKQCLPIKSLAMLLLLFVGLGYIFRKDIPAILDNDTRCR